MRAATRFNQEDWRARASGDAEPAQDQLRGLRASVLVNSITPVSGSFADKPDPAARAVRAFQQGQHQAVVVRIAEAYARLGREPATGRPSRHRTDAPLQSALLRACRELIPDVRAVQSSVKADPEEDGTTLVFRIDTTATVDQVFDAERALHSTLARLAKDASFDVAVTYRFVE